MTKGRVLDFIDRNAVNDEACEWLVRLDGEKPLSGDELRELVAWLKRSPAHRDALERHARLWDRMDTLAVLAVPLGRSRIRLWRHLAARVPIPLVRPALAVGCAAVALVVAVMLAPWGDDSQETAPGIAAGAFATSVGEMQTVALADGSTVQLNTDTRLRVKVTPELRSVVLSRGEAHFEVASAPDVPFVVYTAMGAVRAVGTAFGVRILTTDVEVTVSEGTVDLDRVSLAEPVGLVEEFPALEESLGLLVAGQTVRFNGPGDHLEAVRDLGTSEVVRSLSWREGLLTFSGETLAEVIDEVGRYTNTEVLIVDPAIRDMRIGGVFRTGETDALLDVLETSFGIRVSRTDDHRVELSRGGG